MDEALSLGARKVKACEEIGVSIRTLQRWRIDGELKEDKRPSANRVSPLNKLTEEEQQQIVDICNQKEYANLPVSQIVPLLADKGDYLASESTFYRLLKEKKQLTHRGKAKPRGSINKPKGYKAAGPNEVWTWDISYCPSTVVGQYYYLYMIEDIYSRKIVGWEVHDNVSFRQLRVTFPQKSA